MKDYPRQKGWLAEYGSLLAGALVLLATIAYAVYEKVLYLRALWRLGQ